MVRWLGALYNNCPTFYYQISNWICEPFLKYVRNIRKLCMAGFAIGTKDDYAIYNGSCIAIVNSSNFSLAIKWPYPMEETKDIETLTLCTARHADVWPTWTPNVAAISIKQFNYYTITRLNSSLKLVNFMDTVTQTLFRDEPMLAALKYLVVNKIQKVNVIFSSLISLNLG